LVILPTSDGDSVKAPPNRLNHDRLLTSVTLSEAI
jgi:hypothetical protein